MSASIPKRPFNAFFTRRTLWQNIRPPPSSVSVILRRKSTLHDASQTEDFTPEAKSFCHNPIPRAAFMQAIEVQKFGGPEVLIGNTIPVSEPSSSEILTKVYAAGINPIDLFIRKGEFINPPKLPLVPGKEAAGVVVAVGEGVTTFKKGDRVVCCLPRDGGYAEYVTCSEDMAFHLPQKLSFAQGAGLYVAYFSAFRALFTKGRACAGKSVLIHGASGSVGQAAVQIAKAEGLFVAGTAGSKDGIDRVKACGADVVFSHKSPYSFDTYDQSGYRFDLIIETSASKHLNLDLKLLKKKGRIVILGSKGPVTINPRSLINTEGVIHGLNLFGLTKKDFKQTVKYITDGVEAGWLFPYVAQEYFPNEIQQAHYYLEHNSGSMGKLVINFEDVSS